jgi:ABC-type uncharacterized transport system auxiliary subunit
VRAFEIRLDGGERAEVELFVRILNDRNGVVRASRVFEASAPVAGTGNNAMSERSTGLSSRQHSKLSPGRTR